MIDDDSTLDGLLEHLADSGRTPDPTEHPSDGTLSAYAAKELPAENVPGVQEHLAVCGRCRDLILEYASFVEVPLAEGVADLEAAKEWRALQARMAGESGEASRARSQEPERDRRLLRQLRAFQAVAAVLAAAVVGLSLYLASARGRTETIRPLPEKTADFSQVRGPQTAETVQAPCALRFLITSDHPSYEVEILDANGKPVYSWGPIDQAELEQLILPIGEDLLPPGTYTVRLSGLKPGQPPEPVKKTVKLLVKPAH